MLHVMLKHLWLNAFIVLKNNNELINTFGDNESDTQEYFLRKTFYIQNK